MIGHLYVLCGQTCGNVILGQNRILYLIRILGKAQYGNFKGQFLDVQINLTEGVERHCCTALKNSHSGEIEKLN